MSKPRVCVHISADPAMTDIWVSVPAYIFMAPDFPEHLKLSLEALQEEWKAPSSPKLALVPKEDDHG